MKDFFTLTTPARVFRFVAVIEAITWAALLIGMGFKYIGGIDSAVRIPGMAHGGVFVVYLIVTVVAASSLKWWTERPTLSLRIKGIGADVRVPVILLALIASIPPFFTVWFEVWARRNGHLGELSASADTPDDERDRVSA
ncbi:DUF3817 domain-containing protein [Gordonia sp. PDNC005]|uniref:DUF3817 domain-containing protein n=1 Tax=unclassified Gordonia (in: high G+C Gram-positive bacteria) TaxID=2657482 RepID=UPI001962A6B5|nr:DUF3817 domain-containing protein [Gordonia sp. PDNC005]QRY63636.1 DUF3817 domain-containing protein [Gordonia sp. PDNC005]